MLIPQLTLFMDSSYFLILATMSTTAMNILVYDFGEHTYTSLLGVYLGGELVGKTCLCWT